MPQRVLLIRFSAFGDILLTSAAIRVLKDAAPDVEIHVLTKAKFAQIFQFLEEELGIKIQIHTISDHASFGELVNRTRELKTLEFLAVYDLHNNLRSRAVALLLNRTTFRINKHRLREWALFFGRRFTTRFLKAGFSRAQESAALIAPLSSKQISRVNCSVPAEQIVCISAESAWKTKCWPFDRFVDVAQVLRSEGYQVIWLGLEQAPQIPSDAYSVDLRGKTSVNELSNALEKASVLVCNDTGLLHLSEVVGTPAVAIFGPTTRELGFAPRLSESEIVESTLWCRPCSKNGKLCHRLMQPQKCLTDVSVEHVLAVLRRKLTNKHLHARVDASAT